MVRNRSCPAVSHISKRTACPGSRHGIVGGFGVCGLFRTLFVLLTLAALRTEYSYLEAICTRLPVCRCVGSMESGNW